MGVNRVTHAFCHSDIWQSVYDDSGVTPSSGPNHLKLKGAISSGKKSVFLGDEIAFARWLQLTD